MAFFREEDNIQEMLDVKSALQANLSDLNRTKNELHQQLRAINEHKERLWKSKASELQKLFNLRMTLVELDKEVQSRVKYVEDSEVFLKSLDTSILDQMNMTRFSDEMSDMGSAFQGAINFYSDDSLQLEYVKRHQLTSERRVELTHIENEYKDMTERIQREKEDRIRAQQEEEERKRMEEERRKQMELEKAKLEMEKQRESYRQKIQKLNQPSITPVTSPEPQSFLDNKPGVSLTGTSSVRSALSNSVASANQTNLLEPSETGRISPRTPPIRERKSLPSFSQLCNW